MTRRTFVRGSLATIIGLALSVSAVPLVAPAHAETHPGDGRTVLAQRLLSEQSEPTDAVGGEEVLVPAGGQRGGLCSVARSHRHVVVVRRCGGES